MKKTNGRFLLYTPNGDYSSIGAFWDSTAGEAKAPIPNMTAKHKYDHLLTNYIPETLEYKWDFLRFYNITHFTEKRKIAVGYPDHAILLAKIKINNTLSGQGD